MATKQTAIRLPVGILEAIDARRDADNDRTAIIINLLTSALTGEYIKPKENTTQIIGKLAKTVKSLESAIDELSYQIKQQAKQNHQAITSIITESRIAIGDNIPAVNDDRELDDDIDNYDDAIEQLTDDLEIDNQVSSDYPEFDTYEDDDVIDIDPIVPTQFTHQEFIEQFGGGIPDNAVAVLINGDICNISIASKDAVLIIDPRSRKNRRLVPNEILHYQLLTNDEM